MMRSNIYVITCLLWIVSSAGVPVANNSTEDDLAQLSADNSALIAGVGLSLKVPLIIESNQDDSNGDSNGVSTKTEGEADKGVHAIERAYWRTHKECYGAYMKCMRKEKCDGKRFSSVCCRKLHFDKETWGCTLPPPDAPAAMVAAMRAGPQEMKTQITARPAEAPSDKHSAPTDPTVARLLDRARMDPAGWTPSRAHPSPWTYPPLAESSDGLSPSRQPSSRDAPTRTPVTRHADVPQIVRQALASMVSQAIPAEFKCMVSHSSSQGGTARQHMRPLASAGLSDPVASLFNLALHDDTHQLPYAPTIHIFVRCANPEAARVLRISDIKFTLSEWLDQHGWSEEQVSTSIHWQEVSHHDDDNRIVVDTASRPRQQASSNMVQSYPASGLSASRPTVVQHITEPKPEGIAGVLVCIQQQLGVAGGSGSVLGLISGVTAGLLVVIVIISIVINRRPPSAIEDLKASAQPAMPRHPRALSRVATGVSGKFDGSVRFHWKHEWGRPPLYVVQEHPEIDWAPFLNDVQY